MKSYIVIDVIWDASEKMISGNERWGGKVASGDFPLVFLSARVTLPDLYFFHYWTKLMFSRVCIYCLSRFRFICLFRTILGCDPLPAKQPVNSAFCILKHWERSASCVCLSHQKPFSCISGTDKLWQELKFGWRTVKVFHLGLEKKMCTNVNFMDILCVYLVLLTRFKNKAAGVVGFSGVGRRAHFLHISAWVPSRCWGFLPQTKDLMLVPQSCETCFFFFFLKLIHAMCELVIYMSGMHLFTMSSKMSPAGTACLELVLTGSGWRKRHFIKALATTTQSFKVPYIGIITVSSLITNVKEKSPSSTCFSCSFFKKYKCGIGPLNRGLNTEEN